MSKKTFINKVKKGAIEGFKKYKILPSLTISQAILESGWGKSHISNNLFGIKAGTSWKGKTVTRQTKEYVEGKYVTVNAKFRAYNNFSESIEDHAKLLGENKRYKKVTQTTDYKTACKRVHAAGYATDPKYAEKLIKIIEQNKLYNIDKQVLQTKNTKTDFANKLVNIKLNYNNKIINVKGYFNNSTNYIPVRTLEKLGYKIDWDSKNRIVIIKKE